MEAEITDTSKKVIRSPDFKYIPCDSINIGISDNGVKIILGVDEMDGSTLELAGVHMPHHVAVFLKAALTKSLEHYEERAGIKFEEPELKEAR